MTTINRHCFPNFAILQVTVWMIFWAMLSTPGFSSEHLLQEMETLEEDIFALNEPDQHGNDIESFFINRTCPRHFSKYNFPCLQINDGCYCIVKLIKKWVTALYFCRQFGMELLSLETEQEEQNLANFFRAEKSHINGIWSYFMSANRLYGNRTTWMWAGLGTPASSSRTMAWREGEPSGTWGKSNPLLQEECVGLDNFPPVNGTPKWNDLSCDHTHRYFICEFPMTLPSI